MVVRSASLAGADVRFREGIGDADLAFYLQVYRDPFDAWFCLASLRRQYPGARVIMISDGDDNPRYARLARRYGARFTRGERLYPVACGGRMLQRMLDAFLEDPRPCLIKIDTDTRFHRRLRYLPEGRVVFGSLETRNHTSGVPVHPPTIQGGFSGMTRETAERLARSGLLLSPRLLDPVATYADTPDIVNRAVKNRIISTDHLLRFVCRALEIPPVAFDEVYSIYRGKLPRHGGGFAATHPHKSRFNRLLNRLDRAAMWMRA